MTKLCSLVWIFFFCVSFVLMQNKDRFQTKKKPTYLYRILLAMVFSLLTIFAVFELACFFKTLIQLEVVVTPLPPTSSSLGGQRNTFLPHYRRSLRPARVRDPAASLCVGRAVTLCRAAFCLVFLLPFSVPADRAYVSLLLCVRSV